MTAKNPKYLLSCAAQVIKRGQVVAVEFAGMRNAKTNVVWSIGLLQKSSIEYRIKWDEPRFEASNRRNPS